uniref:Uncharacterized protein n=1 Tax=Strigops habroptila TaxID=2489341 RepID=A0A672UFB8_STRHB
NPNAASPLTLGAPRSGTAQLRASSDSHSSSTDECPLFLALTWIFLWSRCLAKLLSETLALLGSPALSFSTGIRLVSRVLSLGWKYFRAWKSLWMACPTTILSFKIFRIWKRQKGLDRQYADGDRDADTACLGLGTFPQRGAVVPSTLVSALRASSPAMGVCWLPGCLGGLSSPFCSSSARRSMNRWCLRLFFLLRPCGEPGPSWG